MPKSVKIPYKKPLYIALLLVLVLVLAAIWYHYRPVNKKVATIPSNTSVGSPASEPKQNNDSSQPSASNSSSNPTPTQEALVTPWGNFVSNHRPGQNGAPNTETSTCNTTPGATCYIKFVSGSRTRYLDKKIANANGAIIWNWDVKSAGFSSGSWQVSAVASLNNQTKTADDSQPLVVQ